MRPRIVATLLLAAALLAPGPVRAREQPDLDGAWDFVMTRPEGLVPRSCQATLEFRMRDDEWTGVIRFRRILSHETIALSDLVVSRTKFEARVIAPGVHIEMRGEIGDGLLSGFLDWEGADTYPWSACRPGLHFEPGLVYHGNVIKADARQMGLDREALSRLVIEARDAYSDALVVLKNGRVVCERTFGHPPGPLPTQEVTRFVTAIGIAMLLDEKKIASLDEPLSTWYPDWKEGRRGKVTLRHVLTHTSGIHPEPDGTKLDAAEDRVAFALSEPVDKEPGKVHAVSHEAVALLGGIFPRVAGMQADEYLGQKLFRPLGLQDWTWSRDRAGTTVADAGLALTPLDLARIGRFVERGGQAGPNPVLSAARIQALGSPATDLVKDQGLLWRLILDETSGKVLGVYQTGRLGQWIVVFPEEKLVGVRLRRFEDEREAAEVKYALDRFVTLLRATLR